MRHGRSPLMVTAHRLENQEALLRKINAGELKSLCLDVANPVIKAAMQKKKYRVETSENLAPEDLHARADVRLGMSGSLLGPDDLVKWEQENWGDAPRFSPSRLFFSQMDRAFEQAPGRLFGQASQVKAWLASNAAKLQVKKDEVEWTGINDWLDTSAGQKVTKQQSSGY